MMPIAAHTVGLSQRNTGLGSPPVWAVDLSFPESVLGKVAASLEEILLFKPVNCIVVVPGPSPGHALVQIAIKELSW